ncbi:unnamed protein product [Schistosoma curassoni]|uniref:Uncharacterized protein n=1 Tax=Schistosoma curassoni TaxID=6186 RepID=A0A183KBP6_9TREM|nr:unnamed protein product [Schistosoma curassoni]
MVVEGSRQETLDPGFVLLGTRQQGVLVILRELVLPDGFDSVSRSFAVRDVTTELFYINFLVNYNKDRKLFHFHS